ncbi:MAG: DUF1232 domain-containing protein [Actinomycetota bacterium]|nr:DUF1232 domain-containing protein [Actinomycetota bacterium]
MTSSGNGEAGRRDMIERRDEIARQTTLKEYALIAPRLVKLMVRLMRDPRVPPRIKAVLVLVAGYLASPIDVIPDMVPGVGQLDDVVIVAFALDYMLNQVPVEILREHWDGDEDVLELIRNIAEIAGSLVPRWLKRLLPG